jgi:hypothetical protein
MRTASERLHAISEQLASALEPDLRLKDAKMLMAAASLAAAELAEEVASLEEQSRPLSRRELEIATVVKQRLPGWLR